MRDGPFTAKVDLLQDPRCPFYPVVQQRAIRPSTTSAAGHASLRLGREITKQSDEPTLHRIGCTHRPLQQSCHIRVHLEQWKARHGIANTVKVDSPTSPDTRSCKRPHIDSSPQSTRARGSLTGSSVRWRQGSGCRISCRISHYGRGKACSQHPHIPYRISCSYMKHDEPISNNYRASWMRPAAVQTRQHY
ncbi:uncharacterized protein M421DRAFT_296493 [Didymella exigua CBS 183.55]|uniref:Uncharacterized protein n=1 Tax=Didymella exigua CBS 183.55 TaxID=1150837 RepID=A0A6A5R9J0_9PLEO|nr:uncharacterized protein M421DRAFT_296493 [Didymella exigua CBS 183.55]KAF1924193.1 hypothetical protein M421DRAFT_296493 [Didymella exigua CBS 183.55]